MSKEIIVFSVGDEDHEPTHEEIDSVFRSVRRSFDTEKYALFVLPYWIHPFVTDEKSLKQFDLDVEKLDLLQENIDKISEELK